MTELQSTWRIRADIDESITQDQYCRTIALRSTPRSQTQLAFSPDGQIWFLLGASPDRSLVIEDSRELQLQREHICMLEARPPDPKGRGEVTIRDLFRATLRLHLAGTVVASAPTCVTR